MPMAVDFTKQYTTPEDIARLLMQRGLAIQDLNVACQYIRNVGYYRLSAYLYPLLQTPKERHHYKQGSDFDTALQLYRFDKKLRLLLFNEMEKIEVSFRSVLANVVAKESGNIFWMTDESMFANQAKFNKTKSLIDTELNKSKEDFILHFKEKYSNPYPPAWILVETLPLGVITRIYENLKNNRLKKVIAQHYGLTVPVFSSWFTVITLTRNSCCHHARVWNKQYAICPVIPRRLPRPWIDESVAPDRTFYEVCIIKWFVDIISPNNDMKAHLLYLLSAYPMVDTRAMGFPDNWQQQRLWL